MSTPEVSVVIPTRNRWPLLATHALPSALSQEDVDFEVVVVDDGSDDETPARLAAVGDPRLRVVRNATSLRLPGARNRGAAESNGRWLAFLDDDDLWSPRKLRAQLDAAEAAGAPWVFARSLVVDANAEVLGIDPFPAPSELGSLLQRGNFVPGGGSNVVVRSDALSAAGPFDEELRFFEDWDLWLRLVEVGPPAACLEVVMARVEHGANMVVRDRDEVLAAFERLMGKHRRVEPDDRRAVGEWLAFEQARAGRRLGAAQMYLQLAFAYRSPGNALAAAGAVFGTRGLRTASGVLRALRGASHLEEGSGETPPPPPVWLERYRSASR